MTLLQVAEYLSMSERTIYEWAQSGRLPGFKLGSSWRFKRSEIEDWLEAQRAQPEQVVACAICTKEIGSGRPLGGICESEECDLEICTVCWAVRGRHTCPLHADLGKTSSVKPEQVENVPAAQSLLGTRVLDGFVGRIEIQSHLVTEDGRNLTHVRNWDRNRQRNEGQLDIPEATRSDRRRGAQAGAIIFESVDYRLKVKDGILETPHRSLKLIAMALRSAGPSRRSKRPLPVSAEQILFVLDEQIGEARKADRHHIIGLYSGTGWDEATKKLFGGDEEGQRFMSSNVSVIGIGPDVGSVLWNRNDPVARELRHYFQATFEDEVAACRATIRDEMTWSGVYLVSRLSDEYEHGYSMSVAKAAIKSLVRVSDIEVNDDDYGEEVLVSKGAK